MKELGVCKIKKDNGYMYLVMPDGTRIPGQIKVIVKSEIDQIPVAFVKLLVNLED